MSEYTQTPLPSEWRMKYFIDRIAYSYFLFPIQGQQRVPNIVSAPGPKGPPGPSGRPGQPGEVGATGRMGDLGATGATGPMGTQGATGWEGEIGATGATGILGAIGEPRFYCWLFNNERIDTMFLALVLDDLNPQVIQLWQGDSLTTLY